jgi:hypothetical protein
VREIAELARHHHRFVQDWFDGTAGLYLEVLNEISGELAGEVEVRQIQGQPDKRVVQAVLLVAWLLANVPALVAGPTRDVFVVLSARPRLKIPRCSLAALSYAESQR